MILAAALLISSSLPSAPMAVPQPKVAHNFNRYDYALYTGIVAYRAGDYMTSEKMFKAGAKEDFLPQTFVDTRGGFVAFSIGMAAIEIGGSIYLHKHHHSRLARVMDSISVGSGIINDAHNYKTAEWEWQHRPGRK